MALYIFQKYRKTTACSTDAYLKEDMFVYGGSANALATSPTASTWTSRTSGLTGGSVIRGIIWAPALSKFIACSAVNRAITSTDGINWSVVTTTVSTPRAIEWSPSLGLAAMCGSSGEIHTSPDGSTWTSQVIELFGPASGGGFLDIDSLCWSPDLSLFVCGGQEGKLATSPDGITWTLRTSPFNNGINVHVTDIAWSPSLSLFVGVSTITTGSGEIATSPDGVTWTLTGYASHGLNSVVWSPVLSLFVTGGYNNSLYTSSDGTTWTSGSYTSAGSIINAGTWSTKLGIFAMAGPGHIITSTNGTSWSAHTPSVSFHTINAIACSA